MRIFLRSADLILDKNVARLAFRNTLKQLLHIFFENHYLTKFLCIFALIHDGFHQTRREDDGNEQSKKKKEKSHSERWWKRKTETVLYWERRKENLTDRSVILLPKSIKREKIFDWWENVLT